MPAISTAWPKACRLRRGAGERLDPALPPASWCGPRLKDTIKTVADLKGRIGSASASPGSTSVYEIGMVLASAGLADRRHRPQIPGLQPASGAALANGALDAALEVAPFTDIAIEQKIAVALDRSGGGLQQAAAAHQRRLCRQYRMDQAARPTLARGGCSWRSPVRAERLLPGPTTTGPIARRSSTSCSRTRS